MRLAAVIVLILVSTAISQAQEQYMELLRSDLKTQRKAIITEVMEFSDADAQTFWKMYREYEFKRAELDDRVVAVIMEYGNEYQTMTNDLADKLMTESFKIDEKQRDLKFSFFKDLRKTFGATTAARFIQLENLMDRILYLQITSQLPLVEKIHP